MVSNPTNDEMRVESKLTNDEMRVESKVTNDEMRMVSNLTNEERRMVSNLYYYICRPLRLIACCKFLYWKMVDVSAHQGEHTI